MRDFTKAQDCTLSKSNKIFEAPPYEGICESALVIELTLSRPFVSGSEGGQAHRLRTLGKGILKQPFMETIMTVMKTQSAAWAAIAGGTWLGGTPGTDNGDFKDIPGVNKGRGLAGNDHIAGNNISEASAPTSVAPSFLACAMA